MKRGLALFVLIALFVLPGAANATLFDRGGGMIYDDRLNVTWLKDANYAFTSNYITPGGRSVSSTFGQMNWNEATVWADQLVYGGFSDWRLARVLQIDGTGVYKESVSGNGYTDFGYNISAPGTIFAGSTYSELAYMYYNALDNKGRYDGTWTEQPVWGLQNTGLFANLMATDYWTGTEIPEELGRGDGAMLFNFYDGYQGSELLADEYNLAWAVRNGDVDQDQRPPAQAPEPSTMLFLCMGLVGTFGWKGRSGK